MLNRCVKQVVSERQHKEIVLTHSEIVDLTVALNRSNSTNSSPDSFTRHDHHEQRSSLLPVPTRRSAKHHLPSRSCRQRQCTHTGHAPRPIHNHEAFHQAIQRALSNCEKWLPKQRILSVLLQRQAKAMSPPSIGT